MRAIGYSIALVALSISYNSSSQPIAKELTGIFSTLRVSERSGDVEGVEVFVVGGGLGLSVVVQGSEGAPGVPLVLNPQIRGNEIEFQVPRSCPCGLQEGRYRGTVTSSGITLNGPANFGQRFLPRGDSYWQRR
jgi:hypothetical protein